MLDIDTQIKVRMAALEAATHFSEYDDEAEDVIKTASEFATYIFRGYNEYKNQTEGHQATTGTDT